MTHNFLIISNPQPYCDRFGDVPTFYRYLAQDKRINLFHCNTAQVLNSARENPTVWATEIKDDLPYEEFLNLKHLSASPFALEKFDLAFCRSLKPFPPGYLECLSNWEKRLLFVNSPSYKQEQIEADFLLKIASAWIPDTTVTQDYNIAFDFWLQHRTVIAKHTNSCGGRGVYKIWYENSLFQVDNFNQGQHSFSSFAEVLNYLTANTDAPLQFVRYLQQVNQGDKRIVVVDGEIYGAYIRRSKSGHWVNNVSGDGECLLAEITAPEREAIASTVVAYQKRGLHTLGYDFLLDDDHVWRISEINAGNIGGFARLEQLTQTPVMGYFIDWLIDFAKRKQAKSSTSVSEQGVIDYSLF
ncbi:MAG: YheC/YheD family protein [Cyanobacteria bacterium J06621_12]